MQYSTGHELFKSAPITDELVCRKLSSFDQINSDLPQLAHLKILESYINLNNATFHKKLPDIFKLSIETAGSYFLNASIFNQFPNLHELNLSNNWIMEVHTGQFQDLAVVNLSHNDISVFNTSVFKNVKIVILHNNHIDHISFKSDVFSSTTLLDLSNNYLHILKEGFLVGFQNLETLLLKGNLLVGIPSFLDAKRLNVINLSNNFLTVLDCSMFNGWIRVLLLNNNMLINFTSCYHLTEVVYLNLSHNNLTHIPDVSSLNLDLVDLSFNKISDISFETFEKFAPLKLDLSFNNISNLSNKMLHNLDYLQFLNMSHNRLLTVSNFEESGPYLEVDFSNNNIQNVIIHPQSGHHKTHQKYHLNNNNITNFNFLKDSCKEYTFVLSGNGLERNCSQIRRFDKYFNVSVVDSEVIYLEACGHPNDKVKEVVRDVIINLTEWINQTLLHLQRNIDEGRHPHTTGYVIFAILVVVLLILLVALVIVIKFHNRNRYHNLGPEREMWSVD
ncbi:carboxypeptidase N subunit 2-like [Aethina tumida]|uniref:carboxypeptidase N subunit 2-like n=1 Tax=Aethina tumida TaxID=116153 RepID=UPI002148C2EA|nr:carboxypeptidase N subunit 2-like [Aethina tumida]